MNIIQNSGMNIRAAFKFTLFGLWCALVIPFQALWLAFDKGRGSYTIPLFWHGITCALFGMKKTVIGTPSRDHQTIFVANHLSYLDIIVIASCLPASFIAKAEVAKWPLFGTLARLQRTVFVSRSRQSLSREKDELAQRLDDGTSLIIFAEGTSSDGRAVLPFKSSLLGVALDHDQDLYIQPFSLCLRSVGGEDADDQSVRDSYAWYGDMEMPPHLWGFGRRRGAALTLIFHDPVPVSAFSDRKMLAQSCRAAVAYGLETGQVCKNWHQKVWHPEADAATIREVQPV